MPEYQSKWTWKEWLINGAAITTVTMGLMAMLLFI